MEPLLEVSQDRKRVSQAIPFRKGSGCKFHSGMKQREFICGRLLRRNYHIPSSFSPPSARTTGVDAICPNRSDLYGAEMMEQCGGFYESRAVRSMLPQRGRRH